MDEPDRKQFNIRLNATAEKQLEELAAKYNLSKAAIIKMAVAEMYDQYFPNKRKGKTARTDDDEATE